MTARIRAELSPSRFTAAARVRDERRTWLRLYLPTLLLTLICGAWASLTAPHPRVLTLLLYLAAGTWILLRPVMGIYAVVFFTLLGDAVVTPWYPFAKNLSSRESISFLHDDLVITPIELMLSITVLSWLLGMYASHSWRVHRGRLLGPLGLFIALVVLGLVRAVVGAGDVRIAIFEGRALLYLPAMYFLITQLFDHESQYRRLFQVALVALLGHSLFAINYYQGLGAERQQELESLTEHSASVHIASVLILLGALYTVPGCSKGLRLLTLVVAVPATLEFVYSERRSANIGLAVGVVLLLMFLFKLNRRALVVVLPVVVLGAVGYLAAFWNSDAPLGVGAQAVKSVVAPEQLGDVDRNSDLYRQLENFDIWFTIRAQPLTGVGFGNPFFQPAPLPYLPGFEFRNYIPHNNVLWIWMKLGVVGFVATMYLFGRAIQHGARSVLRLASGDRAAMVVTAVAYLAMYLVFAYVDIAWDARSTIFLALAMAFSADYVLVAQPENLGTPEVLGSAGSPAGGLGTGHPNAGESRRVEA